MKIPSVEKNSLWTKPTVVSVNQKEKLQPITRKEKNKNPEYHWRYLQMGEGFVLARWFQLHHHLQL